MRRLIMIVSLLISLPAFAAVPDAYYAGSLASGRADGTADGYAAACRAGLSLGGFMAEGNEAVAYLHGAIRDCRMALKQEPGHLHAAIRYGIALSFEAKRQQKAALARIARNLFEKLAAEYPDSAIAHAALGDWHANVAASGFFARVTLGASRKVAEAEFERSFALAPPDRPLMLEYAKFLTLGDTDDRRAALALLADFDKLPAATPLDALLGERALALKAALEAGDKKAIEKAVANATAFNGIEDWRDIPALTPEDIAL